MDTTVYCLSVVLLEIYYIKQTVILSHGGISTSENIISMKNNGLR